MVDVVESDSGDAAVGLFRIGFLVMLLALGGVGVALGMASGAASTFLLKTFAPGVVALGGGWREEIFISMTQMGAVVGFFGALALADRFFKARIQEAEGEEDEAQVLEEAYGV